MDVCALDALWVFANMALGEKEWVIRPTQLGELVSQRNDIMTEIRKFNADEDEIQRRLAANARRICSLQQTERKAFQVLCGLSQEHNQSWAALHFSLSSDTSHVDRFRCEQFKKLSSVRLLRQLWRERGVLVHELLPAVEPHRIPLCIVRAWLLEQRLRHCIEQAGYNPDVYRMCGDWVPPYMEHRQ